MIERDRGNHYDSPTYIGCQALAELYAPLIEGVDVPHEALDSRAVFVQGQDLSKMVGVHLLGLGGSSSETIGLLVGGMLFFPYFGHRPKTKT